jgi:hypothetical protein
MTFVRGGVVPVALIWQASAAPEINLEYMIRLSSPDGHSLAESRAFQGHPTSEWRAGQIVRDLHSLAIPANATPGEYTLVIDDGVNQVPFARVRVN